jgi:hypothetical protein
MYCTYHTYVSRLHWARQVPPGGWGGLPLQDGISVRYYAGEYAIISASFRPFSGLRCLTCPCHIIHLDHNYKFCVAYSADGNIWYSYKEGAPIFSRTTDAYNCVYRVRETVYRAVSREEYSTEIAWREVRGVHVAEGVLDFAADLARVTQQGGSTPPPTPAATWLDRNR